MQRSFCLLAACLVTAACGANGGPSYWRSPAIASLKPLAADARAERFIARLRSVPFYSDAALVGHCWLMHSRPWTAYACPFHERATDGQCDHTLVVAVKPYGDQFVGVAVKEISGC